MRESSRRIPTVDFAKIGLLASEDAISDQDLRDVGMQLHSAFTGCGFAYLINHGAPASVVESMFSASRSFFESNSVTEKESAFPWDNMTTQGYVKPNRERLDLLKEEEGRPALFEQRETLDVNRVYDHSPFPDSLAPEMRPVFREMKQVLKPLVHRFLQALALSLDLDRDHFVDMHRFLIEDGGSSKLRSLYYPPITGPVTPGLIRCGEHSDWGTLTFLLQDDIGGLEVKAVDEGWIQATPVKDSILVNMGDQMEILTNGLFPATRHRVVVPEYEAVRRQHRQSFAFFVHADDDVTLAPLRGQRPASPKYRPVNARSYLVQKFQATLENFKSIA